MDENEKLINQLTDKVKDLEKTVDAQSKIINNSKAELDALHNGFYIPKSEYEKLQELYKIKDSEANNHVLKIDELESKLDLANTKIDLLQEQLATHGAETEQKMREIELKEQRIKELNNQIRDYEALQTKNKAEQLQFIGEKKQLSDTVARYEAHIDDLDAAIKDLLEQIKNQSEEIKERETAIFDLENQLKEEESKNETLSYELMRIKGTEPKSPTLMNSTQQIQMSGQLSLAETQKQLIDAKNKINMLTIALDEAQKEAARAHSLQFALDQRNREYHTLQQQMDQKELELVSDRKVMEIYNQQIKEYRDQFDEVVSKANTQCHELNEQIKYYKQAALDIDSEKQKLQSEIDQKCTTIDELNAEIVKLQSKQYGLAESIAENRTLKSMISQKQAAIADLIFQIKFYETILATLERDGHLPSGFDYDGFINSVVKELEEDEKREKESQGVKIMTKAIARHQNKKNSIQVIVDQETTIAPPPKQEELDMRFSSEALNKTVSVELQQASIQSTSPPPSVQSREAGTPNDSFMSTERTLDQLKPRPRDKTFRLSFDESIVEQMNAAAAQEQKGSNQATAATDSVSIATQDNAEQYQAEIASLRKKIDLYKDELRRVQQQNEDLNDNVIHYKLLLDEQAKKGSNISKTETSTSISPTSIEQIPMMQQNVPPLPLSTFDSTEQSENEDSGLPQVTTQMAISESAEQSSDDQFDPNFLPPFLKKVSEQEHKKTEQERGQRITLSSTKQRFMSQQFVIPKKVLPKLTKSDVTEIMDVKPPRPKLASDMCKLSLNVGVEQQEPGKLTITKGIQNEIEEVQMPINQVLKENNMDLIVVTTKDSFLIHKAQLANFNSVVEKIQRKASTRKHTIKELEEKSKQQQSVQEELQKTNNELKEQLSKQREEFQERLLQMRNETDRYIELQMAEMRRGTEFSQEKQTDEDEKKSKELAEVSRLLSQLKNDKQHLEVSLEESRDTAKYMQRRNHELSEQVKLLESELMTLREKQSVEPVKTNDFQKYAKKLKVKLDDLQEKYRILSEEHEELKRKKIVRADVYGVEIKENAVDDLPQDTRIRNESVRSSNSSMSAKQSSIEALKVKRLQAQIEESNVKNGELQTQLARQIETNKRLQKLLQSKESTTMQMQSQIATLKQQLLAQKRRSVTK